MIWRYMSLAKFIAMLDHHALHFTPLDQMEDKFEGTVPVRMRRSLDEEAVQSQRSTTFVNCWHVNEYESAAMWDIYARRDSGVAIQSRVGRMRDSMRDEPRPVHIGLVRYLDMHNGTARFDDVVDAFISKHISYQHERELRALVLTDHDEAGLRIRVDVSQLVERVYVMPTAGDWFRDVVHVVCERFDLDPGKVKESTLWL